MTDERGVLRRIAWREVFPWLVLLRTFRLAISPTLLLVATLGVFVTSLGWNVAPYLFFSSETRENMAREWRLIYFADVAPPRTPGELEGQTPSAVAKYLPAERSGVVQGYFRLTEPFYRVFRREMTVNEVAYYAFGSLWTLAVWALAGGIITRRAVVEFGIDETPGFFETVRFAAQRYVWYLLAPLYPLLGVLLLTLPIALLGLLARMTDLGVIVAGILWIFVILAGIVAAWLLAGLLFGWPLMWGTISAERDGDAFEAFSRSFSYVYAKPLHYLFYVIVAALFGALCWAVVAYASELVIEFGKWAYSWGAGREKVDLIFASLSGDDPELRTLRWGGLLMALAIWLVRLFALGFTFSFFWCVAGAIYLLLRQDVDDKEFDDVYVPMESPAPVSPLSAAAVSPPPPEPVSAPSPTAEATGTEAPPP